jgi:Taurine catabolism dioxygenase TauD, TfdA family
MDRRTDVEAMAKAATIDHGEDATDRPILAARTPLPPPPWFTIRMAEASDLAGVVDKLRMDVVDHGCAAVQLDRALTTGEFMAVGRAWGNPIPEHAPAVQPFVEEGCVLHLIVRYGLTDDVDRQPFSATPILLHTEGSLRPTIHQPRHLLFDCLVPPTPGSGGQTVVVGMRDVVSSLDPETRIVLSTTRYAGSGMAPVLRRVGRSHVICFRDFGGERPALATNVDAERVERAFSSLLAALYNPRWIFGLPWRSNMLVLLDNWRVLHGRTAICHAPGGRETRHLRRIRILDGAMRRDGNP